MFAWESGVKSAVLPELSALENFLAARAAIVPIYKKRGPLPAQLVGFVSGHGGVAIVWGCCCEAEKREGRGARGAKDRASGAVCAWCWALPFFRRSREEATPILNHVEL